MCLNKKIKNCAQLTNSNEICGVQLNFNSFAREGVGAFSLLKKIQFTFCIVFYYIEKKNMNNDFKGGEWGFYIFTTVLPEVDI